MPTFFFGIMSLWMRKKNMHVVAVTKNITAASYGDGDDDSCKQKKQKLYNNSIDLSYQIEKFAHIT